MPSGSRTSGTVVDTDQSFPSSPLSMDRRSDKDIILSNMMSSGEDQLHNQANSNNTASAAAAAVAAAAGFNISDHDYDALLKSSSSTYSLQPSSTLASEARDGTDADNLSAAATAEGQSSSTTILNPITTANASQDVIAASGNESSTPASLTRKVTAPTGGGGGIVGDASTGVSETKLRRFLEHNQRLREQLEMNRVPVSVAGQSLIQYVTTTRDALLPMIWDSSGPDPFAKQSKRCCTIS